MMRRSPRWSTWGVVAALIAGACPLASSSTGAAAADQASAKMVMRMEAVASRATICTGDSATYPVVVNAYWDDNASPITSPFPGLKVEAYPNDKSLGSFTKGTATTRSSAGGPATATFTFKAGTKAGKTSLVFQGRFSGLPAVEGYVSTDVKVAVVDCQYQVSSTLRFSADFSGGVPTPAIKIIVLPTKLQADSQGHISGSAPVNWVSGAATVKLEGGSCTGTLKFARGDQVAIEGDVNDKTGVVGLTFKFPPALGSWSGECNGIASSLGTLPFTVTQLQVFFRSDGGVATVPARISSNVEDGSASFAFKKLKGS